MIKMMIRILLSPGTIVNLGRIVLALSCNSFIAIQRENLAQSMELVTSHYSTDLRNLIMYLLTNPQKIKTVNDIMPMIGALQHH